MNGRAEKLMVVNERKSRKIDGGEWTEKVPTFYIKQHFINKCVY